MTLNFVATVFLVFPEVAKVNPPFKSQISYFVMHRNELPTTSVCNSRVDHQWRCCWGSHTGFVDWGCWTFTSTSFIWTDHLLRVQAVSCITAKLISLSLSLSHFRSLHPCMHICNLQDHKRYRSDRNGFNAYAHAKHNNGNDIDLRRTRNNTFSCNHSLLFDLGRMALCKSVFFFFFMHMHMLCNQCVFPAAEYKTQNTTD